MSCHFNKHLIKLHKEYVIKLEKRLLRKLTVNNQDHSSYTWTIKKIGSINKCVIHNDYSWYYKKLS